MRLPVTTLWLLLCALLCPVAARANAESGTLVVAIDPGHGGRFPHDGAHGPGGGVEKNVALAVAQRLGRELEKQGITVLLTREDDADVPLAQRAALANDAGADVFLSIHCNSMPKPADRRVMSGIETYFLSPDPTDAEARMLAELENGGSEAAAVAGPSDAIGGLLADLALAQARTDSAQLARLVHRTLVHETGAPGRGVRQAPFLVLAGARMPAALVEIGYISHPQEGRALLRAAYQQRVAVALAHGIADYARTVLARRLFAAPGGGDGLDSAVAGPSATR